MRKLKIIEHIWLDGVIQAPGRVRMATTLTADGRRRIAIPRESAPRGARRALRSVDNRPMRSPQKILRHALELSSEFFHCSIFSGNFTRLSAVQSYLCGD
jgi:hypothetical protein